ncbi:MAG TPA: MFS transporter, partial [Symbiobacteriaceae bacterium]|nr:MFS transporter [Symbiobacteriaceae bacterium]
MAAIYFLFFGAFGAMGPYQGLYYKHLGLSGTQISVLMSMLPVLLFVSQPLFGPLADRSGNRGRLLAYLLLAVGAAGLLMGVGTSFLTLLPLVMLWGFLYGPVVPIADSVALGEAVRTGSSFPHIRLWGSIGFLIVTVAMGRLYTVIDLRWAFPIYALINVVAWKFASRLPAEGAPSRKLSFREMGRLLRNPFLLGLLLCGALIQATLAAHATFFTIHMASIGGSSAMAGLGWGFSALTEVPVMMVLNRVTQRTGPLPLLVFASAMYALRWLLFSTVSVPAVLVGLQGLQSLTMAIFMPTAVVMI